jgi:hypothetical protein
VPLQCLSRTSQLIFIAAIGMRECPSWRSIIRYIVPIAMSSSDQARHISSPLSTLQQDKEHFTGQDLEWFRPCLVRSDKRVITAECAVFLRGAKLTLQCNVSFLNDLILWPSQGIRKSCFKYNNNAMIKESLLPSAK